MMIKITKRIQRKEKKRKEKKRKEPGSEYCYYYSVDGGFFMIKLSLSFATCFKQT